MAARAAVVAVKGTAVLITLGDEAATVTAGSEPEVHTALQAMGATRHGVPAVSASWQGVQRH